MDWENERYVRLYTRETVDDLVLSWEAMALWHCLVKKFDRAGIIHVGVHGWKGLALLVKMPAAVVVPAGEELLTDGRIIMFAGKLVAPNFIEAQESKQSDKQRKAESRARQRDQALAEMSQIVTNSGDSVTTTPQLVTKQAVLVTVGHDQSHLVTPTLPEPTRLEPNLLSKPAPPKPKFDFESIYQQYPKRTGKAKGLAKLAATVKTPEDFAQLTRAVEWMSRTWRGHDNHFCPGFLPFANGKMWADDEWPKPSAPNQQNHNPASNRGKRLA